MNRQSLRKKLDYLPLFILIVLSIVFIVKTISTNIVFNWKHYCAIGFILLTISAFYKNHKTGVLFLGFTLLLVLLGLLSFAAGVVTSKVSVGSEDTSLKIIFGDPVFLVILVLHFILSGRYYFGIGTKKYWKDLFESKTAE
jgi:hypothetical protein